MTELAQSALTLMRLALALLDNAGEDTAAVHLQHAIDIVCRAPVPRKDEG